VAYAFLAGMPPIYGLYASLTALLLYPLFSTSRFLAVGPVALVSIILMSGLSGVAEPYSPDFVNLVLLTGLLSGIMQIALGMLNMGSLAKFLSKPVLKGFITGAAVVIGISQLKVLLGLDVPRGDTPLLSLYTALMSIGATHMWSAVLGLSGIAVILVLKKINKYIPSYLLVVISGTITSYYMNLESAGVSVLGTLPKGLQSLSFSFLDVNNILKVLPTAGVISLICFISAYSIAKAFEEKQTVKIVANRELLSLGFLKIVGSFFMAMPSSGSFSRSSVMAVSGAKSKVSYFVTAAIIVAVLLFLGKYLYYLPFPLLAAIIIASVVGLVDVDYAKKLFAFDKKELWQFMATFILTVVFGVVTGIVMGVIISLLAVINKLSKPHYAVLGKLANTNSFRNINRYSDVNQVDGTLIVRYDQNLFFGNCDHFYESMYEEVQCRKELKKLIFHVGSVQTIDSTALEKVKDLISDCNKMEIRVVFTNMSGPMRDVFKRAGLFDELATDCFYLSVADAVDEICYPESEAFAQQYSQTKS